MDLPLIMGTLVRLAGGQQGIEIFLLPGVSYLFCLTKPEVVKPTFRVVGPLPAPTEVLTIR